MDVLDILKKTNENSLTIPEDPLFKEIQIKLEKADYKQEELIKDMKLLINKCVFIKEFNKHFFLNKDSFEIFDVKKASKIIFILNLINFINIINAISYYTRKQPEQFPVILNKLSINFSWFEDEVNKELAKVVVMTPKSPVLYNFISTHGNVGIKDEEYKELVKDYCMYGDKYTFDNGYSYEDLSISHLIESLDENNFEIRPSVMYYIKSNDAQKLIDLKLVEISENNKLNEPQDVNKYKGYNERDLIISMLQREEIELNINFSEIINHNLNVENNKLILEEGTNYIFEIKVLINDIINSIEDIEKKQTRFINALKNVKINDIFPDKEKKFKSILMCDHSPIDAKNQAIIKKDTTLKNSNIIYSGVQLGISFVNTLNNNLKDLNRKIDTLQEINKSQNKKMESQNEKIES